MELANVLVAIETDRGHTVPKRDVTPAEIAVLVTIHGNDSVFDIEPTGQSANRSFAEEMDRLIGLYGSAKTNDGVPVILTVYPGVSPILHTQLADLGLDPGLFKAEKRMEPAPKKKAIKPPPAAKPAPVAAAGPADVSGLFDDEETAVVTA